MTYEMTFACKYKPNSGRCTYLDRTALLRTVNALFDTFHTVERVEISPETESCYHLDYDHLTDSWWVIKRLGRSNLLVGAGYKTLRGALNRLDKLAASEVTDA
jgi:hypothetical protein